VRPVADIAGTPSPSPVGVVLNKDDTWLHLIDEPIGARFEKDFERGVFISST
jgi:hypothetical protein